MKANSFFKIFLSLLVLASISHNGFSASHSENGGMLSHEEITDIAININKPHLNNDNQVTIDGFTTHLTSSGDIDSMLKDNLTIKHKEGKHVYVHQKEGEKSILYTVNGVIHRDGNGKDSAAYLHSYLGINGLSFDLMWFHDGKIDRGDDLPASISYEPDTASQTWYSAGEIHRENGPAIVMFSEMWNELDCTSYGVTRDDLYYLRGEKLSLEEFSCRSLIKPAKS